MGNTDTGPLALGVQYLVKVQQLYWTSSEVIIRRGLLYWQTPWTERLHPDFDGMVSEKGKVIFEIWLAMAARSMGLWPAWALKSWTPVVALPAAPAAALAQAATPGLRNARVALKMAGVGIATAQRRVTANAKRLGGRRK